MKKRLFLVFAWLFIVPISEAEELSKWTEIYSENGLIEVRVEKAEHYPRIVQLNTQACVGHTFLCFVQPLTQSVDSHTFMYSEYRFLGVSGGSMVLKLKTYSVSIFTSDPRQKRLLDKLQTFNESKTWEWDYALSVVWEAPAISKKEDVVEDVLFIPLKQSAANFCTPPHARGAGIVSISLAQNTSLVEISFRTFDEVYPSSRGTPKKSQ